MGAVSWRVIQDRRIVVGGISAASRLVTILLLSFVAIGCAALKPQIFSDGLRPSKTPVAVPETFDDVEADIASVQRRYIGAVTDLSNITPSSNAALIGLSAFALFKGLTGGSSKDIAGAGVLGSAIWAYGSTMTSKPRQQIYIAGAAALSCAVSVAKPYDVPDEWLKDLNARASHAAIEFEKLRDWQERHSYLNVSTTERAIPAAPPKDEECKKRQECLQVATTNDSFRAANKADCERLRARLEKKCAPRGGRPAVVITPSPQLLAAFKRASDEQNRLGSVLTKADRFIGAIEMAAPNLWDQSVQIQLKVSSEVLKTEPDPNAVLTTVKNLRQTANLLSGRTLGGTGSLQSGILDTSQKARGLSPAEDSAITALEGILISSYRARVQLERMVAEMEAKIAKVTHGIDDCKFTAPAQVLTIIPSADELQVPLGEPQTFFVSGGSGSPIVEPVGIGGAKIGNYTYTYEPGRLRFVYTVPTAEQGGKAGDKIVLTFKDGSGELSAQVTVTASAATGGTKETKSEDKIQQ